MGPAPGGSPEAAASLRRFLRMAGRSAPLDPPGGDLPTPGKQTRLIVSVGDTDSRRRIGAALAAHGLCASLQAEPDEIPVLDVDRSAIVTFTCNLDSAAEIAALRRLRQELPTSSVIAISPRTTGSGVRRALEAGADAVVFEPELEATLAVAVSAVASGQSIVPRNVRAGVGRPALSHRERQVMAHVARGLTNDQIAEQLFLSKSTIKSHLSSAFAKFGVLSRREAAAIFREMERTGHDEDSPKRAIA